MGRRRGDDGAAWLAVTALLCLGAVVAAGGGLAIGTRWSAALEWRPALGLQEPWRLWTAAWVHWSGPHLAVNLAGAVVVGAVGWRARAPRAAALAWLLAWPLTHALLAWPDAAHLALAMQRYGGLSGVLHAGVVVLGLTLARTRAAPPDPLSAPAPADAPGTQQLTLSPSRITEGPWAMTTLEELAQAAPATGRRRPRELAPLTPGQAARQRLVGMALVAGTLAKVLLEAPWDLALRPNALLGIAVAPLAHACGIAAGVLAWSLVAGLSSAARAARAARRRWPTSARS